MKFEDFVPLLFIAALFVGFHFLRQKLLGPTVTVDELAKMLEADEISVLDIRTQEEFYGNLGHITGAANIPVGDLGEELSNWREGDGDKDAPIVTICRTHNRSPRAARMLRDAGFKNVVVLKGGMVAWKGKGLPVE